MDVAHIALLANLSVTPEEAKRFAGQFADTLKTVDLINELDTSRASATPQVIGLENVSRPDKVTPQTVLTVKAALSNAPHTDRNYFVVPAIFDD